MSPTLLQKIESLSKKEFNWNEYEEKIIWPWQRHWLKYEGKSYRDNATGIDANMKYHLAKNIHKYVSERESKLIEALKVACRTLDFYGDALNYESVYEDDEMDLHRKIERGDVCYDEDDQYFGYAGENARAAESKIAELLEGL